MSKDDMMGPYSEKVMDHFMEPRNMGDIKDADAVGTVGNPACGDVMRLYIKVDGDKITEAKFKTFGCGAAIATSSMATEMIKDKSLDEASEITNEAVAEAWMVCHQTRCIAQFWLRKL